MTKAEIHDGICFLRLRGDLDRDEVRDLRDEIHDCLQKAPFLVFDFGAVTLVNGSVLSLLAETLESLTAEGWVGVLSPLPEIEQLFHVARLYDQPNFFVFPTKADILKGPANEG